MKGFDLCVGHGFRLKPTVIRALQEKISSDEVPDYIVLPPIFGACMKKLETIQDHFFVTGPVMASTILETVLEIEHFTCQLYKDLDQ